MDHHSIIPNHELAVRFSVMPRARRRENEMDDQRENDQHHQIEQFGFVYHDCLLGNAFVRGKARARKIRASLCSLEW
jgi:hypothetical protein